MNRNAKWGVITALTFGLITPMFWHDLQPYPAKLPQATPAPDATPSPRVMNTPVKKGMGNEKVVAKDIARTAALCVRDCRLMLTEISNELAEVKSSSERMRIIRHHMKEHPQFVAITLRDTAGLPLETGRPLRPDLLQNAHQHAMKDQFYVSDLYTKPQAADQREQIGMTLGVPVLNGNQVTGTLSADVEMGHMLRVIRMEDQEMDTATSLVGLDGKNEMLKDNRSQTKGGVRAQQISSNQAEAKVDGTGWKVRVSSWNAQGNENAHVPDEVLVRFNRDLTQAETDRMAKAIRGKLLRAGMRHAYVFRTDPNRLAETIQYFRNNGALIAEPHVRLRQNALMNTHRVSEQPNDVFYSSEQWNLPLISADKAWQLSTGNPDVVIAVVDTGVDLRHPEFRNQLVEGRNMLTGSDNPQDDNGHGTHVAGVIGARTNNLEGIAGINWKAKIMPIKAMAADGSGDVVDIADGIVWAVDHGADVINLSLGEYNDSDYLHDAIRYAHDQGAVIVAAMGNDGIPDLSYPAAYPEVIGVAANDESTETATFSNYGTHTSVSAPGVAIASTYPDRRYVALSGTSMAAPHVAGVAALVRAINPKLNPDEVRQIIEKTADDLGPSGPDEYYGHGQINVGRAVQAAKETLSDTQTDTDTETDQDADSEE